MKTNYITLSLVAIMTVLLLTGCGAGDTIKIGLLVPLTGEAASFGQNALAGAQLAVREINDNGGINGKQIQLIVEDDKCSSDGVTAIQKLININKVDAVVGPVCSPSAAPALPIAEQNGVPVVIIAASAPQLTSIGENIFRIYPSDTLQGKEGAKFLINKLEKKKAALLYTKNDWGEGLQKVFKKEYLEMGGEIVYESGVLVDETDLKTEIAKIKESGAEVIYAPIFPVNAIATFKQMEEMNLNIPIVGGDALSGDEVVKSGQGNGAMYSITKIDTPEEFKLKINNLVGFKNLDVSFVAPIGYDALKVMSLAIEKAGTDKPAIIEELKQTSYSGISNNNIQFDNIGDLKETKLQFYIIENKESKEYN